MQRKIVLLALLLTMVLLTAGAQAYNQAPMLDEAVKSGQLPPVEERLPANPQVVTPVEEIGQYGGTFRVMHTNMMNSEDGGVNVNMYETILTFDRDDGYTVLPNLAEAWEFNDDFTSLTLFLRQGIRWSDGAPFTAEDILFWYQDVVLNDELTPAKPASWVSGGELMQVEQIDEYTIRLSFKEPYPLVLVQLARSSYQGLFYHPKHYLKQFHPNYASGDELKAMARGAGFEEWWQLFNKKASIGPQMEPDLPTLQAFRPRGSSITSTSWERNPYYWKVDPDGNQLPYVDRIEMTLVDTVEMYNLKVVAGEVDLAQWNTDLANLPVYMENAQRGGYRVLLWSGAWPTVAELQPNFNHPDPVMRDLIRNVDFRKALSLGIDREEINNLVFFGLGEPLQTVVLSRGGRLWDESIAKLYTEYDPDTANALLDSIGLDKRNREGYRLRPDGQVLRLTLEFWPGESGPAKTAIAELVVSYWNDLGINAQMKTQERGLRQQRVEAAEHDFTLWHGGLLTDPAFMSQPWHYVPMFTYNSYAPQWARWYNSRGTAGEEPPAEIKHLYTLWDTMNRGSEEEQVAAAREMIRDHVTNLRTIGTVGLIPQPVVVAANLRNVPEEGVLSWDWYYIGRYNPEQFFFRQ